MMNSTTSFFNRKGFLRKAKKLSLFGFLAVFAIACHKADNSYLDTPDTPGNAFNVKIIDTSTLRMTTERDVPSVNSTVQNHVIGCLYDPLFGRSTASAYSQVLLQTYQPGFKTTDQHDSTVLILKMTGNDSLITGSLQDEQTWNVFALNGSLDGSTSYKSNVTVETGKLLGTYTGKLTLKDSILRIRLNGTLAASLFAADAKVFNDNTSFNSFLKGIAIVPDTTKLAKGKGAIIPFNFVDNTSGITVYYNDSLSFHMIFGSAAVSFGHYTHDYTGTPVEKQLNGQDKSSDVVYAQSMDGLRIHVEVPNLNSYVDNGLYTLNQAQFVFPIVDSADYAYRYQFADRAHFRVRDVSGSDLLVYQFPSYLYNFLYRPKHHDYSVIVTEDVQHLLDEYHRDPSVKRYGFNLSIPSDDPVALRQNIMAGPGRHSGEKAKLVLVFTKL